MKSIALLMLFAGCATEAADADQIDNDSGKADGSYPGGVFESADKAHDGTIGSVTLSSDKTFSRTLNVAACPTSEPDCGTTTGTYKFSHSTTTATRYIRFLDAKGVLIDRYAYALSGEDLTLTLDGTSTKLSNIETTELDAQDELCQDDKGNALGECPDDFFCQNYVDGSYTCLPPT